MIDDKVRFCSCDGRGVRRQRPLRGGLGVQRGVEMTASLSRTELVCVCTNISTRCVLTFALKLVLSQTRSAALC